MYTGNVRYRLNSRITEVPHQKSLPSFKYQSYDYVLTDVGIAPTATITLVLDYKGEQKMILSSSAIGYQFKISQEAHYNRNIYNEFSIDGSENSIKFNVDEYFDFDSQGITDDISRTFALVASGFEKTSDKAMYFHKLLQSNEGNTKYQKPVEYYNVNTKTTSRGSAEAVFRNGNILKSDNKEKYDVNYDLVMHTFNFGDDGTYPGDGFSSLSAYDAHWILDVYPYLVWGNTYNDYKTHTAYERFVWDKAASTWTPSLSDTGRMLSGKQLTNEYEAGRISNKYGTPIPLVVKNGAILLTDTYSPTFNLSRNFLTFEPGTGLLYSSIYRQLVTDMYDNSTTHCDTYCTIKIDDSNVKYSSVGYYTVYITVSDKNGNTTTKTITISISNC